MFLLTETQRLEAIATCDRIEALSKKLEADCTAVLATLDRLSRDPLGKNEERAS